MTGIDFRTEAPPPARQGRPWASEPPPEILFERLLQRYERRFGAMPPFRSADVEEAIRMMRRALAADRGETTH